MSTKLTKEEFLKNLDKNTYYQSRYKDLLFKFGLKENKCEICGLTEWNNKPLVCQIHHINGNRTDNRLENLQMLCPNCHSQTENYQSKNTFRYNGKDRVCKNCGKPFVAKGDGQKFCSRECLRSYNCRHQRVKTSPYSTEYLKELCNKYNTLDEIGFVIHCTKVTVKRYLVMHGLYDDFKKKRNFCTTPVLQYDANDNFIKEWPCIRDAQDTLKIYHIGMVCKGQRKSAGGFKWKYKNDSTIFPQNDFIQDKSESPTAVKILQYDLNGNFIREFNSVEEASEISKTNKTSIVLCMQHKHEQANNYVWRYKENDIPLHIDVPTIKRATRAPVLMYDINKNLIKEFSSMKQASEEMGLSISRISQCVRGKTKSCGGYIWRYKDYSIIPIDECLRNLPFPTKMFHSRVRVLQYNLGGQFIKEYGSMAEASRATGINLPHIAQCTYGERDSAGNYMWKIKEGEEIALQIKPYKQRPKRAKPVLQYDIQGNLVHEYQTIEDAMHANNISRGTIMKCLQDPKKSYAGCVWRNKSKGEDTLQNIDVSEVVFDSCQNAVVQKCDLEGNLIQEYPSISAASKDSGVSRTHIKHSIEGRGKCIDNYIWKYK